MAEEAEHLAPEFALGALGVELPAVEDLEDVRDVEQMIEFSFHNCRALLPIFRTSCPESQMDLILPKWGLSLPRIPHPNPCSLISRHTPRSGICTYTKQ